MGFQNLSREWVSVRGSHLFTKSPFSFLPPSAQRTEWDNASWPLWTLCGLSLVPITSALKVEWTVSTVGFWVEPQNQLYPPQLRTLLCESSLGGPGDLGLRAWPSLDTARCFLFGSRRTQCLLELPLNIHEITVCGLDESRDFPHHVLYVDHLLFEFLLLHVSFIRSGNFVLFTKHPKELVQWPGT